MYEGERNRRRVSARARDKIARENGPCAKGVDIACVIEHLTNTRYQRCRVIYPPHSFHYFSSGETNERGANLNWIPMGWRNDARMSVTISPVSCSQNESYNSRNNPRYHRARVVTGRHVLRPVTCAGDCEGPVKNLTYTLEFCNLGTSLDSVKLSAKQGGHKVDTLNREWLSNGVHLRVPSLGSNSWWRETLVGAASSCW